MTIRISETGTNSTGNLLVSLAFDGRPTVEDVPLHPPHSPSDERKLEWYFEKYSREPYTPEPTVDKYRQLITAYGENLFQQLFGQEGAQTAFEEVWQKTKPSELTIELDGASIAFQAMHWESLKKSAHSRPLALNGVMFVRRQAGQQSGPRTVEAPWLNLLIVTARPGGAEDVNPRTIQRPIIELLEQASVRVRPYILRPGTFRAFIDHLDHHDGHYHLIHFDLHGAVLSYDDLVREKETGRYEFRQFSFGGVPRRYGIPENIEPYEGKRAYIFFESDEAEKQVPVEATELGDCLENRRIPACIFNACQSARQEGAVDETSLGKILVDRSLQLVLAMRYTVTVDAATILMQALYKNLVAGLPLERAIALGRLQLWKEKRRKVSLGMEIALDDWLLPVVFKRSDLSFQLRELAPEEEVSYYREAEKRPPFEWSISNFLGRDLDILAIEKSLLKHPSLLIRGMAGAGKSALLRYLCWWWETTRFREACVYIDFSEKQHSLEDIVEAVARRLLDEKQYGDFFRKNWDARKGSIAEMLKSRECCVLLDNIFQLEDEEILGFVEGQSGGKTHWVFGSVNPETALSAHSFRHHVHWLDGLDEEVAWQFARQLLDEAGVDMNDLMTDEAANWDMKQLLELLGRLPGAMRAVLPQVKKMPPGEVLASFREGTLPLGETAN